MLNRDRHAAVVFRGNEYVGEVLYHFEYPHKIADEHGNVIATISKPQRVGLLIEGRSMHFTVPSEVRYGR